MWIYYFTIFVSTESYANLFRFIKFNWWTLIQAINIDFLSIYYNNSWYWCLENQSQVSTLINEYLINFSFNCNHWINAIKNKNWMFDFSFTLRNSNGFVIFKIFNVPVIPESLWRWSLNWLLFSLNNILIRIDRFVFYWSALFIFFFELLSVNVLQIVCNFIHSNIDLCKQCSLWTLATLLDNIGTFI